MFNIFGITFHGYGLLIGLGVWMAMEIAFANRGEIKKEMLEKAMWWTIASGVVGARTYHVIDYWSRYYVANPLKVLFFWEGGLGIWGAIMGGVVGLLIYCFVKKQVFIKFLDIFVVGVPLAQAIGRVGNFINGELYGKNGEPLFLYEGVLNLFLFGVLWKMSKKKNHSGAISGVYLLGYGVIRALLENLRPEENIWKVGSIPMALIISGVAIVTGGYLIFRRKQS